MEVGIVALFGSLSSACAEIRCDGQTAVVNAVMAISADNARVRIMLFTDGHPDPRPPQQEH